MAEKEQELLAATRTVLAEHGFHELTTQRVADAAGVNQSLVHYHFDTKRGLVAAFLDWYRERFARLLAVLPEEPGERLATLLTLVTRGAERPEVAGLGLAVYELQAYAGREDAYREPLRAYHELLFETVTGCIAAGVESGAFHDRDTEQTARLLLTALDGAMLQQYTVGADAVSDVLAGLEADVLADLYVDTPPDVAEMAAELDLEAPGEAATAEEQ